MKFDQRPLSLLKQIESANVDAINTRAASKDLKSDWSGIGFSLCGQHMVAPMGQVVEIINVPNYTYVPRTKNWVLGVANVRGRMLPIFDIENYFGSKLTGNRSKHRVLIIESEHFYAGLIVSNVFGLKHFPVNSFKDSYQGDSELFAHCIDAIANDGNGDWLRFQMPLLVKTAEFIDASMKIASSNKAVSAA
ncbi:MAG: chemotaxis protein CheW [Pseudomonadales bacterium]